MLDQEGREFAGVGRMEGLEKKMKLQVPLGELLVSQSVLELSPLSRRGRGAVLQEEENLGERGRNSKQNLALLQELTWLPRTERASLKLSHEFLQAQPSSGHSLLLLSRPGGWGVRTRFLKLQATKLRAHFPRDFSRLCSQSFLPALCSPPLFPRLNL